MDSFLSPLLRPLLLERTLEPQHANAIVLSQQIQLFPTSGFEAADGGVAEGEGVNARSA